MFSNTGQTGLVSTLVCLHALMYMMSTSHCSGLLRLHGLSLLPCISSALSRCSNWILAVVFLVFTELLNWTLKLVYMKTCSTSLCLVFANPVTNVYCLRSNVFLRGATMVVCTFSENICYFVCVLALPIHQVLHQYCTVTSFSRWPRL